jgi:hypothetical protein
MIGVRMAFVEMIAFQGDKPRGKTGVLSAFAEDHGLAHHKYGGQARG